MLLRVLNLLPPRNPNAAHDNPNDGYYDERDRRSKGHIGHKVQAAVRVIIVKVAF